MSLSKMTRGQRVKKDQLQGARPTGSNNLPGSGRGVRGRAGLARQDSRLAGTAKGWGAPKTKRPGRTLAELETAERRPRPLQTGSLGPRCVASRRLRLVDWLLGEPRPLSCSRAGFGVAAIFVDVSAPRVLGAAAEEIACCWPCSHRCPHCPRTSRSAGPLYEVVDP